MNKFLRTASTSRVLAAVLGVLATAVVGTAIAIAAIGSGPVPKHESLARAIHQGLAAPAPDGVYARISFTNNLIESSEIQGSDPLLTGGTGRLWWTGHHLRLEVQGDNGDAQVVVNGRSFWAYDPALGSVYEGTLPAPSAHHTTHSGSSDQDHGLPSVSQIQSALTRIAAHVLLSDAIPTDVGGQPAYSVRISPRHDNGLLGTLELAWDAQHRAPLQISLFARGNPTPVLELSASDISFGPQSSSVFDISPPAGAKVVRLMGTHAVTRDRLGRKTTASSATGVSAVARRVPFTLQAPAALAGRARTSVRLLSFGGHPAALLIYGHGLGAIVVLEHSGGASKLIQSASSGEKTGLTLPTVTIDGVTGQQLQTAIGTVLRFTRAGVAYTVLGSVTGSVADAAARGL
jgi:outer membrane lipoprotein-sorting protein